MGRLPMIYDRQWFLDVRAKLDEASSLKQTPPQNVIEPKPDQESPAYSYSSGNVPVDHGMYSGFVVATTQGAVDWNLKAGDVVYWGEEKYRVILTEFDESL